MATRRGSLRSSVFVFLVAIAAAHVPACEYGTSPDPVTAKTVATPRDAVPAFVLELPIALRA